MTTRRRYHFTCPVAIDLELAELFLARQCERYWWYQEPAVVAAEPGFELSYTVHARDQWWCHQRAIQLVTGVCEVLGLSPHLLSDPLWTAPDPHTNRGYQQYQPR